MISLSLSLSLTLQRCFTLMDRGFTFKLINNYINMITATDSKVKKKKTFWRHKHDSDRWAEIQTYWKLDGMQVRRTEQWRGVR